MLNVHQDYFPGTGTMMWLIATTWKADMENMGKYITKIINNSVKNLEKYSLFTSLTFKLLFSCAVMSDACRSFIPNEAIFTKWISKLPGTFEIHRVWQYLVNFTQQTMHIIAGI